jgi:8-oxo-dGTP diphosphatase
MKRVHVVAAVIKRGDEILIARRPDHVHQGGKWEFPGGKVEPGEAVANALNRELQEELGIQVIDAKPLITIAHDYPDKQVLLDVWRVSQFAGEPQGLEGQEVKWVESECLPDYEFPAANVPIVAAARLPSAYVITPELDGSVDNFVAVLRSLMQDGYRLFQLRIKDCEPSVLKDLIAAIDPLRTEYRARILVNSDMPLDIHSMFDGVHLTSRQLQARGESPKNMTWVAASCHSQSDIQKAEALGVDFITLSPYRKTQSHPEVMPISADDFHQWVRAAKVPVYALGGVSMKDEPQVLSLGAQGVAGIRGFWPTE